MAETATQPSLSTLRLVLRPFSPVDVPRVSDLANDARIAELALGIPHPYPIAVAEAWIAKHASRFISGSEVNFAVTRKDDGKLLGTVSLLAISTHHARAELGYWIGSRYWSMGYCTEAVLGLIDYAQGELGLTRITGRCLVENTASARVLSKAGLQNEGRLTGHVFKNGQYRDMLLFGRVFPTRDTCHVDN